MHCSSAQRHVQRWTQSGQLEQLDWLPAVGSLCSNFHRRPRHRYDICSSRQAILLLKKVSGLLAESRAGRQVAEDIEHRQANRSTSRFAANSHQKAIPWDKGPNGGEGNWRYRGPRKDHYVLLIGSHMTGYSSFPVLWHPDKFKGLVALFSYQRAVPSADDHYYLSFQPRLDHKVYIGHHSALKNLTDSGSVCFAGWGVAEWAWRRWTSSLKSLDMVVFPVTRLSEFLFSYLLWPLTPLTALPRTPFVTPNSRN